MTDFTVLRPHWGDKANAKTGVVTRHRFKIGETRTAEPGDVAELVARKILSPAEAKAAPAA